MLPPCNEPPCITGQARNLPPAPGSPPPPRARPPPPPPPPPPPGGAGPGWLGGFDELASSPQTPTVGIARLAASAPLEGEGKGVDYYRLPVRSLLNRVDSRRVGFTWSINPYRGCEFGCQYCYAVGV